jgi:TonB family protein
MPRVTLLYWQALLLACLLAPLLQPWKHEVVGTVSTSSTLGDIAPAVSDVSPSLPVELAFHIPWEALGLILGAGIILRLIWLLVGCVRLRYLRHRACLFLEEHAAIREMQWRTGVRASMLLSGEIDSPVTFGFHSPTVILPLSFQELSEPCQKAVVCHELLHVRRFDWIWIVLEETVRSIFWFHPAIWWVINRIHLSREQAVDHQVVEITGSKQPYLDSLLEFARSQGRPKAVPAPLFLKERHLVQRVALLIKEASMSRSRLVFSIGCIAILLAGVFTLASGWFPLTGAPVLAQERNDNNDVDALKREPLRISGPVTESKLIRRVEPVYPEEARRARIQGVVVLTVHINEKGFVSDATVVNGHPLLQAAAVDAVKQWRYSQTLLNGEPVSVIATVSIVFRLSGDTPAVQMDNHAKQSSSSLALNDTAPNAPEAGQLANSETKPPRRTALRVGDAIQQSKLISKVEPIYPREAKAERLEGTVVLQVTVNEEGLVSGIIASPGNYQILEDAAIEAVRQWKYSPTLLNGEPVPVFATVTVVFRLGDPNDLDVVLDESGNLSLELSRIQRTTGSVRIQIAPKTSFRIVERTVQELVRNGVQRLKLAMPFVFYQGRVFYAGALADAEPFRLDMSRLVSIAKASGQFEAGRPYRLVYRLYLNEAGEPLGLQRLGRIEIREIESELMRMRRAPATVGSEPVPYMYPVMINFIG